MEISALKQQLTILEVADRLHIRSINKAKPFVRSMMIKHPACSSAKRRISAPALVPNAMPAPWILSGLPKRN
jgi:hypothetical protein